MYLINVGLLLFIVTTIKLISCTELDSKNLKYRKASNNGLIDVSTKSEVIKNKNLLQACLDDYVTSHLKKQPKVITAILTKHITISNIYLEELQKIWSTFVLTENYNVKNNMQKTRMDIFILLRDHNDLDDLKIKIYEIGSRGSTYTVLLVNHFKNKKLFIKESNLLTKLLWTKKLANIVIIGFVENYYLAMESNEFKPKILREPMDPVIVGQCQNGKWIINNTLFRPMKMNNCSVNVGYLNNKPYMYTVKQKNNKLQYKGIDLSILRVVASYLNFTIKLSEIAATKNDTIPQRIVNSLSSKRSYDLVIGGIPWQPTIDIDYTIPYDVVKLVWLIPVDKSEKEASLPIPVTIDQWIIMMAILSFPIIFKFILFHEISFLDIFAIFIGVACNKQPVRFPYRIFFMSWFIFGCILLGSFSSPLLGKILFIPRIRNNTIKALNEANLTFGGSKDTKNLYIGNKTLINDNIDKNSNEIFYKLFKNFDEFESIEYEKKLQDLMSGKNKNIALLALINTSTVHKKFKSYIYILPDASMSIPLSFAVWHGLPYANDINIILQRLISSGIIEHFNNIETKSYHRDITPHHHSLKLKDLSQAFSILGIGLTISLITLIFEIINFRTKIFDRIYIFYLKFARQVRFVLQL
ncbi:uncharacterized protein LOC122859315 [Aphidius gifuensis]|uniref:uncharacterized protein LOC122859315 n=1 Tax=Aphidius gifuensis TaxID=684658 RepID=UPI001CDB7B15|nr:uncharacterized protein LOC122859315 [Aphidius gifuensis]XP_044018721.1 uncharacterized protein LOC122859315 [Aphidius gifuensis]